MWRYNSTEELIHGYKYIKKIKTGSGYRYFYNQAEIDAYNQQKRADINRDLNKIKQSTNLTSRLGGGRNPIMKDSPREKKEHAANVQRVRAQNIAKHAPGPFTRGLRAFKRFAKKAVKEINKEAAGFKRAVQVVSGNHKDKKGTASMYSVDGKYYDTYKKDKKGIVRLKNRTKRSKTGRLERAVLAGYRAAHPNE